MAKRTSWTDYFLGIADSVAVRADCTRRKAGAVIVDASTRQIISTGYNGAPPGKPGCLSDGACPRGRHYDTGRVYNAALPSLQPVTARTMCGCGLMWPCSASVSPGSSYDTGAGSCIAIHAEANALLRAGDRARGNWLFTVPGKPCDGCMRLIEGAGIHMVVWYGGVWYYNGGYRQQDNRTWLILKPWQWMLAQDPIAKWLNSRSGKPTPSS